MKKRRSQKVAFIVFRVLSLLIVLILFAILGFIIYKGAGVISWDFLSKAPSDGMTSGGIFPAIVGTLLLMLGSAIVAFPVGIMSGIYMNEYASRGWPLVIRTTEEALKDIPAGIREGSLALGATKLQTIWKVVLPMGMPRIITGLILSLGRVSGETAPILFTCAAYFFPQLPASIFDQCMALPYHLYVISTSGTDIEAQQPIAYGTALVLIVIVLVINLLAGVLRRHFENRLKMK